MVMCASIRNCVHFNQETASKIVYKVSAIQVHHSAVNVQLWRILTMLKNDLCDLHIGILCIKVWKERTENWKLCLRGAQLTSESDKMHVGDTTALLTLIKKCKCTPLSFKTVNVKCECIQIHLFTCLWFILHDLTVVKLPELWKQQVEIWSDHSNGNIFPKIRF